MVKNLVLFLPEHISNKNLYEESKMAYVYLYMHVSLCVYVYSCICISELLNLENQVFEICIANILY